LRHRDRFEDVSLPTLTRLGHLADLNPDWLHFNRGIERETLRVDAEGRLAQTPHPSGLGSALTHPSITTDYSESLLEFITSVHNQPEAAMDELAQLHRFTYTQLPKEQLWPCSMPSLLPEETEIPIAQYGTSHVGKLKTVYRHGLWHRYGRVMQTIAGVHYNWSMPTEFWQDWAQRSGWEGNLQRFINEEYFSLIRGFRRHSWLLLYLFGASPAIDRSFAHKGHSELIELGDDTLYSPYATTLRMSDMGYSNNAQSSLYVCFNSLQTYSETLTEAIHTPYSAYQDIGTRIGDDYRQISANVLQIENEYYSDLRPKRVARSGEKPIHALNDRGVEYIEVRCLDIDPFSPLGVDTERMVFVDLFLFWCLVQDNALVPKEECFNLRDNNLNVAAFGRDPELMLSIKGEQVRLKDQGQKILSSMAELAGEMDALTGGNQYQQAVTHQLAKIDDVSLTPSARFLELVKQRGSYRQTSVELAEQHRKTIAEQDISARERDQRIAQAQNSLDEQTRIEATTEGSFDEFLTAYLRQ
jgi:glutamate--cysteine ligase